MFSFLLSQGRSSFFEYLNSSTSSYGPYYTILPNTSVLVNHLAEVVQLDCDTSIEIAEAMEDNEFQAAVVNIIGMQRPITEDLTVRTNYRESIAYKVSWTDDDQLKLEWGAARHGQTFTNYIEKVKKKKFLFITISKTKYNEWVPLESYQITNINNNGEAHINGLLSNIKNAIINGQTTDEPSSVGDRPSITELIQGYGRSSGTFVGGGTIRSDGETSGSFSGRRSSGARSSSTSTEGSRTRSSSTATTGMRGASGTTTTSDRGTRGSGLTCTTSRTSTPRFW